jgi:hypothetical protein
MSLTPDQIADIAARTGQPPELVEKAALALPTVLDAFLAAARALLSAPFMNHVSEQAEALLQLIPEDQRPALLHVAVALAWASASQDGAASPAPAKGSSSPRASSDKLFEMVTPEPFDEYLKIQGPGKIEVLLPYGQGTEPNTKQRGVGRLVVKALNAGWPR